MHDAVMGEFGGSLVDIEAKAAGDVTPDPDMSSEMMGDMIKLEEFQSLPQSSERIPGPLVSLVCM